MNSRLLAKGLLFLIGTAAATTPVALRAAIPPDPAPAAQTAKENPDDTGNPYSVIVERNIFHLSPPPPPPEPEKPKIELAAIKITGFVNIGNQKKVLFIALPTKAKKDSTYFSLSEGEKSGILELVRIHPSEDGVDIINDGTPVTLTVKDDSLLPSTPISAGATPGGIRDRPQGTPGNEMPGRQRQLYQQGGHLPGTPGQPGAGLIPPRMRRNPQQP
jgi:hypothetical protein